MSHENSPQGAPSSTSSEEGSSALDREAKRVEGMTRSKDHKDDQAKSAEAGQTNQAEQDIRVQTIARQAKEAGAGTIERAEDLNQDG